MPTHTPIPAGEAIEAFKDAVNRADAVRLKELLDTNEALHTVLDEPWFHFGAPALVVAAGRSDRAMIDVLLDAGADINKKSDWKPGPYAPLHHLTCGSGRLDRELAEYLIERGAAIDVHAAAGLGRIDLLEAFVRKDPDAIHQRGPDGQMPLSMAGTPEAAAWLLDHGADIHARCIDHGSTAVQWAVARRPDVARLLIERGAEMDVFIATVLGDIEALERIFAADPKLLHIRTSEKVFKERGEAGNIMLFTLGTNSTLLHLAAGFNQAGAIDYLIKRGLDPNVTGDYDDCTPMHKVAWENKVEAAERLIAHRADLERRSGRIHNNTPVGWAIVGGSKDVIASLLHAGAEVLDYYLRDAIAGENGAFRMWNRATPDDYRSIQALLTSHSRP